MSVIEPRIFGLEVELYTYIRLSLRFLKFLYKHVVCLDKSLGKRDSYKHIFMILIIIIKK